MIGKIPDYGNKPASGFFGIILMLLLIPAAIFFAGFAFMVVLVIAMLSAAGLGLLVMVNRWKAKNSKGMYEDEPAGEVIEGESVLIKTETITEERNDAANR